MLQRSQDPRTKQITDRQRIRYSQDPEAMNFLAEVELRMDKGQIEHGDDYKSLNCVYEIKSENFDLYGWFVMLAGYKKRVPIYLQDFWADACIELYKKYLYIVKASESQNIEVDPKIIVDTISRARDLAFEDIPER